MRPASAPPQPGISALLHDSPRRAPVTLALIFVNLLVFVLMLFAGASLWHTDSSVQLAWGASFGPATQDGQWWRLFTAMFLHFGIAHLALNMWALWDVGRLVERLLGRWQFALLYLGSGTGANLLSLAVNGGSAVCAGASGAVFSLYGALLVFLWRERGQVDPSEFRSLLMAAGGFTAVSLAMGFFVAGIDNAAHVGGLVCGALLASALAKPWSTQSPTPSFTMRWGPPALLGACVVVIVARLPAPGYRLSDELRAQAAIRQFLDEDRRLSERWGSLLSARERDGVTFEQLAGRIESRVGAGYQENFEQLSALRLDPGAPSAVTLEELRRYAALRGDASHALAEGLRKQDPVKVRNALESARQAPALARRASAPRRAASG